MEAYHKTAKTNVESSAKTFSRSHHAQVGRGEIQPIYYLRPTSSPIATNFVRLIRLQCTQTVARIARRNLPSAGRKTLVAKSENVFSSKHSEFWGALLSD
jgi:hypothetical protein